MANFAYAVRCSTCGSSQGNVCCDESGLMAGPHMARSEAAKDITEPTTWQSAWADAGSADAEQVRRCKEEAARHGVTQPE